MSLAGTNPMKGQILVRETFWKYGSICKFIIYFAGAKTEFQKNYTRMNKKEQANLV